MIGKLGKHKTRTSHGYILIFQPNHPRAHINGYVYEHILIIEASIGRHIKRDEQIHHINKIKDDNRIENLLLCENQLEHIRRDYGWTKIKNEWHKTCNGCKKLLKLNENFYLRADNQTRFYVCKKCCAIKHKLKKYANKK